MLLMLSSVVLCKNISEDEELTFFKCRLFKAAHQFAFSDLLFFLHIFPFKVGEIGQMVFENWLTVDERVADGV